MTGRTQDWTLLETLFHAVADLHGAAREAYLDVHCPDHALRQELERLLACDRAGEDGIAPLIAGQAGQAVQSPVRPGDRIGVYDILQPLAQGGMGAVYLAERMDGQFRQKVAIKVLRSALPTPQLMARFRHERQILAELRHPNIATLLDGGSTEHDQPYLVMEYVEGEPIDHYCRTHALPLRERLRLIQKVCGAVQAAHQRLIVHRDIKPANILVTAEGVPKLLDFGIAKLLTEQTHSLDVPETQVGQRLMTPEFASPEQVRAEAVGTASDVYSLGVLLYVILTGRSPYERWRTQPLELQKAVCETDPPKPSDTLSRSPFPQAGPVTPIAHQALRGDLDHIVLKAMRKEPAQRYVSPTALAEDLQRFMDQLPIAAREGSRRYVTAKFLRRNRWGVSVTAAVLLTLSGLEVYYTGRLRTELEAAEQAASFMVDIFRAANTNENRPDILARDLLQAAAQKVEATLGAQPLLQARLLLAIGQSYGGIRLHDEAEPRLLRALSLLKANLAPDDPRIGKALEALASLLVEPGRHDEAEQYARQALAVYRSHYGNDDVNVARMLVIVAHITGQSRHDDLQERYDNLEEARRILQRAGEERSAFYARALAEQGSWLRQKFAWEDSGKKFAEYVGIYEQLYGAEDIRVAFPVENLAREYFFVGDFEAARPLFERTIRIIETFKGPQHVDMDWSLYFLARIEREVGNHARARALIERTIRQEEATPQTADNRYLARALCGYALILADAGETEKAAAQCERGRDILRASQQKRVQMDVVHEALGTVALARGDWAWALEEFRAQADVLRVEFDPGQTDTPRALGQLAHALALNGQRAEAESLFAEAITLATQRYAGTPYPNLGRILWARAQLREATGDTAAAAEDRQRALSILHAQGVKPQTARWTLPLTAD